MRHIIFLNGIWPNKITAPHTNLTRSISCYQLKHWLSLHSIKSQVIDFCQLLTSNELISLLDQFVSSETFAIGVSTTYWPTDNSVPENIKTAIETIKDRWPNIKIISGGARKTKNPELFDLHFVGESEDQLLPWCQSQLKKTTLLNRQFNIVDLQHRFDITDGILEGEALPIELGRGCIFKCKFCSHHNLGKPKFTYQRNFQYILDEFEYNHKTFGTTRYLFLDDTVNEDLDKIRNLSEVKDRIGIDIEWTGYLRADLVWSKPESAELLYKSGLKSCFFGIETFHNEAGKSIDKGWAAKHGKEFLPKLYKEMWNSNINIHSNFIAGLPCETLSSLSESLEWCKANPLGSYRFVPLTLYVEKGDSFASSEFTRNYQDYGYKNVNHSSGYWELENMNSTEALEFCIKADRELFHINKTSSWDVFTGTNLGTDTKTVMSWTRREFVSNVYRERNNFKERYLNKLRALSI